jgi:hypothetical protein
MKEGSLIVVHHLEVTLNRLCGQVKRGEPHLPSEPIDLGPDAPSAEETATQDHTPVTSAIPHGAPLPEHEAPLGQRDRTVQPHENRSAG